MSENTQYREDGTEIALHGPTGDLYALRYASVWVEDQCVGVTITKFAGPLDQAQVDEILVTKDFEGDLWDLSWARAQEWVTVEIVRP